MSALSLIFAQIDSRLRLIPAVASYERMPSGDPVKFPALVVYDDGDEPSEQETGSTRLALDISVEGYIEGKGGASTHDQMMTLHAGVVTALCGDADADLGMPGQVESIEIVGKRRVTVAKLADKRRVGFAQDFRIQYATPRGNPFQFA